LNRNAYFGSSGTYDGSFGARRNVSKNQLVCARCHFVGLTSGIELTT